MDNNDINLQSTPDGGIYTASDDGYVAPPTNETMPEASPITPPAPSASWQQPYYAQVNKAANAKRKDTVGDSALAKASKTMLQLAAIVGTVTFIFGCVLFWVYGVHWLGDALSGKAFAESTESDSAGDSNGSFFYSLPDGGSTMPNFPFMPYGSPENDASGTQSSGAGLGITVQQVDFDLASVGDYSSGLLILEIGEVNSFAGLDVKTNDFILAANGSPTPTINSLKTILSGMAVGDPIALTLARFENGVATTFDVTVKLVEVS